jgi:hypothetical protein
LDFSRNPRKYRDIDRADGHDLKKRSWAIEVVDSVVRMDSQPRLTRPRPVELAAEYSRPAACPVDHDND